ncbi:hypothetical protein BDZ45DRAFT_340520 [Acephala macrosclerotiorum]|nr:hypothetical protein BDZ45DRAFT_340520 [Acephala macrosclerotiorum]
MSSTKEGKSKGRHLKGRVIKKEMIDLTIKLFPELEALRNLYHRISGIEARRMELLLEKEPPIEDYSDEMDCEMELTNVLCHDLTRFQYRQITLAGKIKALIYDALAIIYDIEEGFKVARVEVEADMIKQGMTLPAISKAMDWERDTNIGDAVTKDKELVAGRLSSGFVSGLLTIS